MWCYHYIAGYMNQCNLLDVLQKIKTISLVRETESTGDSEPINDHLRELITTCM